MKKTPLVIGLAVASLFFGLTTSKAQDSTPVPELAGKLECGSLNGVGKIHVHLLGTYIGTFDIRCEKV